jgi:signal transduction histidine kinase
MRHSEASNAIISIKYHPEEILLTIFDNGKGFATPSNPTELSSTGHYGLLGMQERAELIGAKLSIQSDIDHGTKLFLQIPL